MTFVALVPAGGAGTRLWPLSRRDHPKFLLDLAGTGRTLIQQTVDRLAPRSDAILIVTGAPHAEEVIAQTGLSARDVLIEPSGRNSMPAIALGAALARERYGHDVVVGSFAADHVIADESAFGAALDEAHAAAERGYVVTIGITPTHAATGFGYIRAGAHAVPCDETTSPHDGAARAVLEFKEKPGADVARGYLETGGYFWNAGMFVARADVLLDHLKRLHPELHAGIVRIAAAYDTEERDAVLASQWEGLESIAIDHAIAEPVAAEGGVAVVPAAPTLGWDDLGDVAALRPYLSAPVDDAASLTIESPGATVIDRRTAQDKPLPYVVTLGIRDAVVLLTDDAVLLTTLDQAQRVGEVPPRLKDVGREDLR
ncbi:MAG: mannose-1-phosphate guanylyltransferase [Bowdeniella nasicola]|nr:mannose-1-phosphate guanylyltransferase [Bowdeniella nasicola]